MARLKDFNGILLLLVLTCTGAQRIIKTMQTTTWNDHTSDKALGTNRSRCAMTGFDFQPQWTAVLDANYSIYDVFVYGGAGTPGGAVGAALPNIYITVNDDHNPNGRVCAHWLRGPVPVQGGYNFSCGAQTPRGSKVSITAEVNKGGHQLMLCDVRINAK